MELTLRIAETVAKMPPELRQLLDAELAAGNQVIDVESNLDHAGNVALILKQRFRASPLAPPPGVLYREITNRDPLLYEFHTPDERFSLVAAVFKPFILPPLPPGPPDPTEAHIRTMEAIAKREKAAAAARAAAAREPAVPSPNPALGDAGNRFIASMVITYEMWHDGTGYDLDALKQLTPSQRDAIEAILINHHPRDWRDIEALAQFDTEAAHRAVEAGLKSSDAAVRAQAMTYAGEMADPADRERLLIQALQTKSFLNGLSDAIDEAADFHPPAVIEALFKGALDGSGEAAVHFAALLFYVHGKATEPFDWAQRPFFLRFNTTDREDRKTAFRELCEKVGADVTKYLR